MNKINIPKGRVFPDISEEGQKKILYKRKILNDKLEYLGINVAIFDSDLFIESLGEELKRQYDKDSFLALALLLDGKDVPQDVVDRLLKIKVLRE